MKKVNIKHLMVMTLTIILALSFSINASAYTLFKYELNGGVGNWGYSKRYYWIDSSASSITTTINNAYSTWINTDNILRTPISWRKTTTKADGTVEFYTYSKKDGSNGYTNFWRYENSIDPNKANWGWCKIYYNNYYKAGQATIAHEIGHTMGLDENNGNPNTIMCQAGAGRKVSRPQKDDLAGINAKYN